MQHFTVKKKNERSFQQCRKTLVRENKSLNEKYQKDVLPPMERTWQKVKDNKKKLIFFALVIAGLIYSGGYYKVAHWLNRREPLKRKFTRWIFGVKNIVPTTIEEQNVDDIRIPKETKEILQIEYRQKEKALKLGLTRKYLYLVYKDLNLFPKDEDKHTFFAFSGYSKKRNQKPAGINLKEFLRLYQQGLEKSQKVNSKLTEVEYREKFLSSLQSHFEKMKGWEQAFFLKRNDFKKMMMEKEKKNVIKEALHNNPLISMDGLEAIVKQNGLIGVGVKEKILVLNSQLTLLKLHKDYYTEKTNMSFGDKIQKYNQKLDSVNAQIQEIESQLEHQNSLFSSYFKNIQLFKEYKDFTG